MKFTKPKRRKTPTVIIVSLIDVLLVVLIFLMVSTTLKKEQSALRLALPESKEAKAGVADSKPFIILVATNAPYFYIQDKPVTLSQLQKELSTAVQRDPQLKVSIKADKRSPFGEVIKIIDAAKTAHVGSISAITEKPAAR